MTHLTAASPDDAILAFYRSVYRADEDACTYPGPECGRPAEVDGRCTDHVGGSM